MAPIRKGDGTPLEIPGVQEVRSGDGRVFFEADAIPDSVEYQWRVEDFADPWPANIGPDMTVSGLSTSTFSNNEDSVAADGDSDYGLASGPETLAGDETFGLAFTVEYDNVDSFRRIMGMEDGDNRFNVWFGGDTDNDIALELQDDNGDDLTRQTDEGYGGEVRAVIINKSGDDPSDVQIFVDDMENPVSMSTRSDGGFDHNEYAGNIDFGFFARHGGGGSMEVHVDAEAGVFEFNREPYSQSERESFVDRRPEV